MANLENVMCAVCLLIRQRVAWRLTKMTGRDLLLGTASIGKRSEVARMMKAKIATESRTTNPVLQGGLE